MHDQDILDFDAEGVLRSYPASFTHPDREPARLADARPSERSEAALPH